MSVIGRRSHVILSSRRCCLQDFLDYLVCQDFFPSRDRTCASCVLRLQSQRLQSLIWLCIWALTNCWHEITPRISTSSFTHLSCRADADPCFNAHKLLPQFNLRTWMKFSRTLWRRLCELPVLSAPHRLPCTWVNRLKKCKRERTCPIILGHRQQFLIFRNLCRTTWLPFFAVLMSRTSALCFATTTNVLQSRPRLSAAKPLQGRKQVCPPLCPQVWADNLHRAFCAVLVSRSTPTACHVPAQH